MNVPLNLHRAFGPETQAVRGLDIFPGIKGAAARRAALRGHGLASFKWSGFTTSLLLVG